MPPDSALAPCPDDVATLQAELTALARRYRPARVGKPPRWDIIRSDFLWIRDMEAAQPPLDAAAVRTEFWRLVRDEGAERTDRVPTREDLHARHHWHGEIMARRCGRNPGDLDLGRTSALIAGRTDRATPVRLHGPASLPVETARGRPPPHALGLVRQPGGAAGAECRRPGSCAPRLSGCPPSRRVPRPTDRGGFLPDPDDGFAR